MMELNTKIGHASASLSYGKGYKRSSSDGACIYGTGLFVAKCLGVQTGTDYFDIEVGLAHSVFYGYDKIAGWARVSEVSAGIFGFSFGGGTMYGVNNMGEWGWGNKIGYTMSGSITLTLDPTDILEFGASNIWCYATASNENEQKFSHECKSSCFPSEATVNTPDGRKMISDLRVGQTVEAVDANGQVFWDDVYFFGHADAASVTNFVDLKLAGANETLQLSKMHFIPKCPSRNPCSWEEHRTVYAKDVHAEDYIWVTTLKQGREVRMHKVAGISLRSMKGLYNPYTLSGTIVVNGVVASAHSDWVLDDWMPAAWVEHLPAVYQAIFLPGRLLYHISKHLMGHGAPGVIATALDVNNPQMAPEVAGGQGGTGLLAFYCGASMLIAPLAVWASQRFSLKTVS